MIREARLRDPKEDRLGTLWGELDMLVELQLIREEEGNAAAESSQADKSIQGFGRADRKARQGHSEVGAQYYDSADEVLRS